MAQIWWSDCKRREQMHKPILLNSFWQKRPFLWPKIWTSNPQFNPPLAFRLKLNELAWTDGSAIFVLHITTHTLYCYNWTFHCFSFRTPYNICFRSSAPTAKLNQLHAQSPRFHTNKSRYKNTVSYSCKGNGSVNWLKTSLCNRSLPDQPVPAHGV